MCKIYRSVVPVLAAILCCGGASATQWQYYRPNGYYFDYVPGATSFFGGTCESWRIAWNGKFFFAGDDGVHGCELHVLQSLDTDPVLLVDASPGDTFGAPRDLTPCGGLLFFVANTGLGGSGKLWATDGTSAGTYVVMNINPSGDTRIAVPECIGDMLYFDADDGVHGREIWISDGTPADTRMLADVNPLGDSDPTPLVSLGDDLIFTADDGVHGKEMHRLISSPPGSELLVEFRPGSAYGGPGNYTPFRNGLVCSAWIADWTSELFFTDGTTAGTHVIKVINDVTDPFLVKGSGPSGFTIINDVAVFEASNNLSGNEPWRTDGTEEGTYILKDIDPRTFNLLEGSSWPGGFRNFAGRVFFTAKDENSKTELWITDGTPEGTTRFPPISGETSTYPSTFVEVNGFLYLKYAGKLFRIRQDLGVETVMTFQSLLSVPSASTYYRGLLLGVINISWTGSELGALNIAPWVVSLDSETPGPTDAQEATFLVTFSEPVMGVDPTNFQASGEGLWQPAPVAADPVGDGTTWRITVDTGLGDGTLYLRLIDDDTITDTWHLRFASEPFPPAPLPLDGYGIADGSFAGEIGIAIDKPAPTVLLETTEDDPTGLPLIPVTATFEHDVLGFTVEDVQVFNATIANFTGAGADYSFELVPQANGLIIAFVPADAAMDLGGLGNAPSNEFQITYGLELRRHTADTNTSYEIELQELLRVIQFYNFPGYHCAPDADPPTEDGYKPGAGDTTCTPHDGDYEPQDWLIDLVELMRVIQFYNIGGYHYCPGELPPTEDGYCPGKRE